MSKYTVISGHLCAMVEGCTCEVPEGLHQTHCGWEPIAEVTELLAALERDERKNSSVPSSSDVIEYAEMILAETFTEPLKPNPDFDRNGPLDDTNPDYIDKRMEERRGEGLMVVERASDGGNSIRALTIPEVVAVLAQAGCLRVKQEDTESATPWDTGMRPVAASFGWREICGIVLVLLGIIAIIIVVASFGIELSSWT